MIKSLKQVCMLALLLVLLVGCVRGQRTITFRNDSKLLIQLETNFGDIANIIQDDTIVSIRSRFLKADTIYIYNAPDLYGPGLEISLKDCYVEFLVKDGCKTIDYVRRFKELNEHDLRDSLLKNVPPIYVFRASLEDLKRLNWVVTYPPTPMQNHIDSLRRIETSEKRFSERK